MNARALRVRPRSENRFGRQQRVETTRGSCPVISCAHTYRNGRWTIIPRAAVDDWSLDPDIWPCANAWYGNANERWQRSTGEWTAAAATATSAVTTASECECGAGERAAERGRARARVGPCQRSVCSCARACVCVRSMRTLILVWTSARVCVCVWKFTQLCVSNTRGAPGRRGRGRRRGPRVHTRNRWNLRETETPTKKGINNNNNNNSTLNFPNPKGWCINLTLRRWEKKRK